MIPSKDDQLVGSGSLSSSKLSITIADRNEFCANVSGVAISGQASNPALLNSPFRMRAHSDLMCIREEGFEGVILHDQYDNCKSATVGLKLLAPGILTISWEDPNRKRILRVCFHQKHQSSIFAQTLVWWVSKVTVESLARDLRTPYRGSRGSDLVGNRCFHTSTDVPPH